MDLLIVEPLEAEVLQWLDARHELFYAPRLPQDRPVFLDALADTRAAVVPPQARIDGEVLSHCPRLRALGRIAGGVETLDLAACARAGVEVVRPTDAAAPAEAEFMLGALLALLRPSPEERHRISGRELGACTVGLVGMTGAARTLARFLQPLGSRLIGYDPAIHAGDPQWARWGVQASSLTDLFEQADAVCVQLPYYSRYKGLLGERVLPRSRAGQVLVSISPLDLFDETALAQALLQGRLTAAWLDCHDPGALGPGRALHAVRGLITTPRLGAYTREARLRSAWSVARRLDELLRTEPRSAHPRSGGSRRPTAPPAPVPPALDRLDAVPDPSSPLDVLDIRSLLPKAESLDLSSPIALDATLPATEAEATRLPAPPQEASLTPRRRFSDEDALLSRSR
jgi:D-3-phosphoglycerate dehydrogenase